MTDGRTELAVYLAERDVPCPGCGYNLRGLTEATCPECAQQLHLHELKIPPSRAMTYRFVLIAGGAGYVIWAANLAFLSDSVIELRPVWISLGIGLVGISSAFLVPAGLRMQRGSEPGLRVAQTITSIYFGAAILLGSYGTLGLLLTMFEALLG